MRSVGLLRQSATVFAGSLALSLGGFAFHALASRVLGVAAYGQLYTIVSLSLIVALPGAVLAPVVTRFAAEFFALHGDGHVRGLQRDAGRLCAIAALAYAVGGAALAFPVAVALGLPLWAMPVVALAGACAFASPVARALAQGRQDFGAYALSTTVEGVVKVLALAALLAAGLRLGGAALGFCAGAAAGLAAIWWSVRRGSTAVAPEAPRYDWRRIALSGGAAAAMTIATTAMGTADVVLVKHFFTPNDAGLYATAALAGKVMLYLLGFVGIVTLPRVTDRHARGESTRAAFLPALGTFVAVTACALLAFALGSRLLLHALVGHAFDAALPLLVPYGAAMAALAFTNLLATYGVATHRLHFAAPLLIGTAATLLAVALIHSSLSVVVREMLAGNVAIAIAVLAALTIPYAAGTRARTAEGVQR